MSASAEQAALTAIKAWHDALPNYQGGKARGSVAAALVALERLSA